MIETSSMVTDPAFERELMQRKGTETDFAKQKIPVSRVDLRDLGRVVHKYIDSFFVQQTDVSRLMTWREATDALRAWKAMQGVLFSDSEEESLHEDDSFSWGDMDDHGATFEGGSGDLKIDYHGLERCRLYWAAD